MWCGKIFMKTPSTIFSRVMGWQNHKSAAGMAHLTGHGIWHVDQIY